MRGILQLGVPLLVMSLSLVRMASGAVAEIREVNVVHDGDHFRIQVTLSSPVIPSVLIATEPDRLVLQLPNTEGESRQRRIMVNRNGVSQVRVGLNSTSPPVMRLVVDLDRPHSYALTTTGNTIVLTVLPASTPAARRNDDQMAVAAQDAPVRRWWRRQRKPESADSEIQVPAFSSRDAAGANAQPGASMFLVVTPKGKTTRLSFKVKYVAEGAAYLSGGRNAGLSVGMKLVVCDSSPCAADSVAAGNRGPTVAELQVVSVAETSAVTEIVHSSRAIKPGDWAYLSAEDYSRLAGERDLGAARDNSLLAESAGKLRDVRPHPLSKTAAFEPASAWTTAACGVAARHLAAAVSLAWYFGLIPRELPGLTGTCRDTGEADLPLTRSRLSRPCRTISTRLIHSNSITTILSRNG
jgi:hypothetical protein